MQPARCALCTSLKSQMRCDSSADLFTDSRAFPIYPLNMLAQSQRAASSIFDRTIQSALRKLAHDGLACAIEFRCGALPNNLALHTQSRQHGRFSIHLAATIFRSSDPCACNMVILSAAHKCFQRLAGTQACVPKQNCGQCQQEPAARSCKTISSPGFHFRHMTFVSHQPRAGR